MTTENLASQVEFAIDSDETDGENLFLDHLMNKWGNKDDSKGPSPVEDEDAALRKRMLAKLDAEEDQPEAKEPDEDEETPSEEGDDAEGGEAARKYLEDGDDDNIFTKVKVGDEEQEVSIASLKRLHGQEAALTQRSQQLSENRKQLEYVQATNMAVSNALLQHAMQQYQPYAQLDFMKLARDPKVSSEQLDALRAEQTERYNTVVFLQQQQGEFMQAIQKVRHDQMVNEASNAIREIRDPASPYHIDGWSTEVYDGLRQFAIDTGMRPDVVNSITDPAAIKLVYMAQQYAKGKAALVKTTKKNNTVTKVVKTSKTFTPGKPVRDTKALKQLARSGSVDDAANAFLANFKQYSE